MFPLQPDISETETGEAALTADKPGQQREAEGGEVSEGEDRLMGVLEEKKAPHPDYILQADTQEMIQDLPPENLSRV